MNTTAKYILILSAAAPLLSSCSTPAGPTNATFGATASSGVKPYPLKTCIVTDNGLGSMGDERRIVNEGREIKFCCEPCIDKFLKNPAKYLSKL